MDILQKSVHEGQKFQCPHCEHKATKRSHLQTHIKSVHEGQKLPCPHCEHKATQKGDLKKHIKSIHEGIFSLKAENQYTKHLVKKEYFEEEDDIKKECSVDNKEVIPLKQEYFEDCIKEEKNENNTKHLVKEVKEYFEEDDVIKKECRVDNEEVISLKHEYFKECMKKEENENSDN